MKIAVQSHLNLTVERFIEKCLGSPVFDSQTFETTSVEDRPFLRNMKFANFDLLRPLSGFITDFSPSSVLESAEVVGYDC